MHALVLALVVGAACPESVAASLEDVDARIALLRGQAATLKLPGERDRVLTEVNALDDALLALRGDLGCRAGEARAAPDKAAVAPAARPAILDEAKTRALVSVVRGERFDDVRQGALESALLGHCVEPSSARVVLDAFPESARPAAWRAIAPRLTDRAAGRDLVARMKDARAREAATKALALPVVEGCAAAPTVDDASSTPARPVSDRPR